MLYTIYYSLKWISCVTFPISLSGSQLCIISHLFQCWWCARTRIHANTGFPHGETFSLNFPMYVRTQIVVLYVHDVRVHTTEKSYLILHKRLCHNAIILRKLLLKELPGVPEIIRLQPSYTYRQTYTTHTRWQFRWTCCEPIHSGKSRLIFP